MTVLAAAFVALVLSDPTSASRQLITDVLDRFGAAPIVLAAAILAVATFVVLRHRDERSAFDEEPPPERRVDGARRPHGATPAPTAVTGDIPYVRDIL